MRLTRYKVTNFRSVDDSGWIDANSVTALVGVNESGKTNLLLPLWKFRPAREGALQPTADYPKKMFGEIRQSPETFCFITAEFETGPTAEHIATLTSMSREEFGVVQVERYYDGRYEISFPEHRAKTAIDPATLGTIFSKAKADIESMTPLKQEQDLKSSLSAALEAVIADISRVETLVASELSALLEKLNAVRPDAQAKTSTIVPRLEQLTDEIESIHASLTAPLPQDCQGVLESVISALPEFVYYSNYGNLDSEIYLPHVVQNLKRDDLGAKESSKARTLRVLFRYVQLEPQEILELGKDFQPTHGQQREPSAEQISEIAEQKRERSILLQSAGSKLTERFKDWWKQGDYRFRFEADGNHFRIWVSDEKRPEEVELESRSTGLQWFLSFYLVFLVESEARHHRAILLLDEPGLSLHPLAQKNLSDFFDGLASTNQLLYTTHSPFLVDADRLERARKVYVSEDGTTKATSNLREGVETSTQAGAAYAVHSALNLSVAESLLIGCQPVIVEGASDQHYLTAIKTLLIGADKISPSRELVFPPSGGTKTARIIASILTGRDDQLPLMLLDSDAHGRRMKKELLSGLYADAPDKILLTDEFTGVENSEIEDLFPSELLIRVIDRWERRPEIPFEDCYKPDEPIVDQVSTWARSHGVALRTGWKVEVAVRAKQLALTRGLNDIPDEIINRWVELFVRLSS